MDDDSLVIYNTNSGNTAKEIDGESHEQLVVIISRIELKRILINISC